MTPLRSSVLGALLLLLLPAFASAQDAEGGGQLARPAADRTKVGDTPSDVYLQMDYPDTDIKDIIKDFSEKYGWNFLIDPKLSGKITLMSPVPVDRETALRAFEHALDATGYALIELERFTSGPRRGKPSLFRVVPAKEAMKETLKIYGTGSTTPSTGRLVTQLVQLNNVTADEISKVISKMISGDGDLIAYSPSNTLIITDSANNVRRLMELINELDISAPRQKLEVVPVRFAEAQRVVDIINELYGGESAQVSAAPAASSAATRRANRRNRRNQANAKSDAAAAASTTSVGDEPTFIGKMIADERTNTIIVLATEKALEQIKDLIRRIDYETDPLASQDIHVVYLDHAKAEEIAQTLNNLIQQANQRTSTRRNTNTGNTSRSRGNTAAAPAAPASGEGAGGNFAGEVRVTHDVATNSLVVTASRDDYRRIKRVIDMLDIPRKQVFVETVIMEVSDSVRDDQGANWHGGIPGATDNELGPHIIGARGSQSINLGSALLDGSLLGGLALGVFGNAIDLPIPGLDGSALSIPAFGVVLRALQEDSSTNVLSAPNLLTLDNKEASIEIGETVPFPTGGFLGSAAGTTGLSLPSISFTREDVGIILRLTPQVNDSGFVTMEIYQEISEVKEGSASDSSGGPTTTKRSAETTVSVQSNQTIVIGGLMQEVETETESKVPILGDIPILGFFFRNKAKTKRKTNLLIFLTPHVIEEPADLQEVYKIKMMQREEFMRRFYGKSAEQQRDELNELIRYSMNVPGQPSVYREWNAAERSRDTEVDLDSDSLDEAVRGNARDGDVLITPDGEVRIVESGEPTLPAGDDEPPSEEDAGDGEQPADDESGAEE